MYEDLFIQAGMTQREVITYTVLLSNGEMIASELSKATGFIRTNVYDILNSLIKKGIVAYIVRGGKKYFYATDPEKLIDYVNNKEKDLEELRDKIQKIIPQIRLNNLKTEKPLIEIYEGKDGLRTIYEMSIRESIKTKKEILGISVQQQKCRSLTGIYHERWYNERAKKKIRSRYIMSSEEKTIPIKFTQFKILPKQARNPNEIFIFGDITSQFFFIGDSFTAIVIKNKEVTDKYRDYFDFLWKLV